jgi:hypothetical protein
MMSLCDDRLSCQFGCQPCTENAPSGFFSEGARRSWLMAKPLMTYRKQDTKNIVRWCSWVFLLWLLEGLHVYGCLWLFAEGCRGSCQASLNDAVGGIELLVTVFSLFVVAFCVLAVRTRCLYLRALFCLNMLALLHCCYMERLWDMGGKCCSTVVGFSTNGIISWMWSVLWQCRYTIFVMASKNDAISNVV